MNAGRFFVLVGFTTGPLLAGPGCSNSSSADGGIPTADVFVQLEAGPPVNEASVCQAALVLPLDVATCAEERCCAPVTTCFDDPACAVLAICEEQCAADGGLLSLCEAQCEADAGTSAANELGGMLSCLQTSCTVGDAGPADAEQTDGSDASTDAADGG